MTAQTPGEVKSEHGDEVDPSDPLMSQLKDIYDSVAREPLPDDLMSLLQKLDEAERNR